MKFNTLQVVGHRRSGTHFVAAATSVNLMQSDDYMKIYGKHMTAERAKVLENPDTGFIFVIRPFPEVARSMFEMRSRFGLSVPTYNEFLQRTYAEMWTDKLEVRVISKTLTTEKTVTKVGGGLKGIKLNPRDFWRKYNKSWKKLSNQENVFILAYADLIQKYEDTIKALGEWAEVPITEIRPIDQRVGWWNTNDSNILD
jgi:hypothetical protein